VVSLGAKVVGGAGLGAGLDVGAEVGAELVGVAGLGAGAEVAGLGAGAEGAGLLGTKTRLRSRCSLRTLAHAHAADNERCGRPQSPPAE
jgi:hypothetical protein